MSPEPDKRHIAYVMTRFPKVTETFVLREMVELERLGWRVETFALSHEREGEVVAHPGVAQFGARAHYGAAQPFRTLRANLAMLFTRPHRYLALLGKTFRELWRSPAFLARALVCFPVAIAWARTAQQARIEHIHAHFATHATYIAYVMSAMTGIPFSFTAHAHDIYMEQAMLMEKMRRASLIVAISTYNRDLLTRLYPEAERKIRVVHCGIDTEMFSPRRRNQDAETQHHQIRILTVARFQEYKGLPYLIDACAELAARGMSFHCTIVGDGPMRGELEAAIARHNLGAYVTLTGWLPSPRVAELLDDADVFALPSVIAKDGMMEGIPNVLMEALSCEIPVISTTISGIPELVVTGVNGVLVPPRNAHALADAIASLADDASRRLDMGRTGRARVRERFDLRTNTARKAQLFENTLSTISGVHATQDIAYRDASVASP